MFYISRLIRPRWGILFLFVFVQANSFWLYSETPKKIACLLPAKISIYNQAISGLKNSLDAKKVSYQIRTYALPTTESDFGQTAQNVRGDKPDLVVCLGTYALNLAREHIKDIPSIYCMIIDTSSDYIGYGGVVVDIEPMEKISFIQEKFPQFKKIGIFYNSADNSLIVQKLKKTAKKNGIQLVMHEAISIRGIQGAVKALSQKSDCLLMVPNSLLSSPKVARQFILDTIHNKLPIIAFSRNYVSAGAFAGIYTSYENNGFLAGNMAYKVLSGQNPKNLPVLWTSEIKIALNMAVAKHLGIRISPGTVAMADYVVK